MAYLSELLKHSEDFRLYTENGGVGKAEIRALCGVLQETAEFTPLSMKFLEILAENKRLIYIKSISDKFAKLYSEFNKEEKITIISAEELTKDQED